MPNYVYLYAKSIPELATALTTITTASSTEGLSDETLNAMRALVLVDKYSWGAAPWFLTTQCSSVREVIQAGGRAGFEAYMACLGTSVTSERLEYWTRANDAFGLV